MDEHEADSGPAGDANIDLVALGRHLEAHMGRPIARLTSELISGGKSNLTYRVGADEQRWILRRPPLGPIFAGAHDVSREYRVMKGLRESPVPVPNVVLLCADPTVLGAPFYLMDEVDGRVLRTPALVSNLSQQRRRALGNAIVDTLATLHEVDADAAGLSKLGRPEGYLKRQLDRWSRQYQAIKIRELPHLDRIMGLLRRSMPEQGDAGIVHGDFRLDNVIVDAAEPHRILAVLDWEMATLGDPLTDLGILLAFWDEPDRPVNPITNGLMAFAGFPSKQEVVERYAQHRNVDLASIGWYELFAYAKLAVILEQIHVRRTHGNTRGSGFDATGDRVLDLLDRAIDRVGQVQAP